MTREQIEKLIEYRESKLKTMLDILGTITDYEPREVAKAISDEENVIAALKRLKALDDAARGLIGYIERKDPQRPLVWRCPYMEALAKAVQEDSQ